MSDPLFFVDEGKVLEEVEAGQISRKIRARGGGLMAVEVFFKTDAVGYEHRHPHEQISYCLSGEFLFTLEGRTMTLKAGDSVYVPVSALHGAKCVVEGRVLDIFTPQRQDFLVPSINPR